ncbi:MAG: hypothetical protein H7234_02045 [Herminiimonas sp.]|nr:hypothetical protein [Herminiimonas sp.]
MKRMPLLVTFLLFVALCASMAYWGLQLVRPPVRALAAPVVATPPELPLDVAALLFGGRPLAVGAASNYQLKGVVVAANGRESVAILSADGKPAQAVGLNTEFQPGVSVREVHGQYILLSEGGVMKRVALPEGARPIGQEFVPSSLPPLPPRAVPPRQVIPVAPAPAVQQPPAQAPQQASGTPAIGQMSTQLSAPGQGSTAFPAPPTTPAPSQPFQGGVQNNMQNGMPAPGNMPAPVNDANGMAQPRRQ